MLCRQMMLRHRRDEETLTAMKTEVEAQTQARKHKWEEKERLEHT